MSKCFLCGKEISGKKSWENIFGDSFLKYINLKTDSFTYNASSIKREYSRLKVPAHIKCNNEFGSRFETEILKIIESFDEKEDELRSLHFSNCSDDVHQLRGILTKWMAKLYLGLVSWEAGIPNHPDDIYQSDLNLLLDDPLVNLLQSALSEERGMYVQSSIYYFSVPEFENDNYRFDFATGLPYGLFFIKFKTHLLVVSLADGYLVSEYFTDELYKNSQNVINEFGATEPFAYIHPISHIFAVRELLPVQPDLVFYDNCILDKSRFGYPLRPEIDGTAVNARAREIFDVHIQRWVK